MSNLSPSTRRHAIVSIFALAIAASILPGATLAGDRPNHINYTMPGTIPQLDSATLTRPIKRVLITNQGLQPSRVTLQPGERIVWESYSGTATSIVFEREVAASMICHSLVNFVLHEDELRSAEIHTGEKASFCELKPGQYRYRAVRANPRDGALAGAAARLDGWIIVNAPSGRGA